jgi:Protein of unknown function (DUF2510)
MAFLHHQRVPGSPVTGERGRRCRVGEGVVSEQPPTEYAPPGWFADPTGLQAQRWWDGTQWGQQTRAARKSWPRRRQVLTVLGSLAALVIVIGGIASTSGNARQAGNASAIAAPTGMATPSRAPTHQATSTKTRPRKVPVTVQATTPVPAATTPAPAATVSAASGSGHYICGRLPAEQRRHLLRTRQILARCRPWGIRDSWRGGSHHR